MFLLNGQRKRLQRWILCFENGRVEAIVVLDHNEFGERIVLLPQIITNEMDNDFIIFTFWRLIILERLHNPHMVGLM